MSISLKKQKRSRPPPGAITRVPGTMLRAQTGVADVYPPLTSDYPDRIEQYVLVCLLHDPKGEPSIMINNSSSSESDSATLLGFFERLNGHSTKKDISILGFTLDKCTPLSKPINCGVTGTFQITLRLGNSDAMVGPMDILDVRHPTVVQNKYSTAVGPEIFPEIFIAKRASNLIDRTLKGDTDESKLALDGMRAAGVASASQKAEAIFDVVFPYVLKREKDRIVKTMSAIERNANTVDELRACNIASDRIKEFISESHRRTMTAKGTGSKGVQIDVYLG